MEQRSENWIEWRRQGIGASDAAALLGISPWSTPYKLWEDKTKRAKPVVSNWAMERGTALEPLARAWYELKTGLEMKDDVVIHKDFPWLRCSLDGGNDEARRAIEIKCPGKDDHAKAKEGKIPEKYFPQCQHILIVTGYDSLDYISYYSQNEIEIVNVKPDSEWCIKYFERAKDFWFNHVLADVAPDFTEKDWLKIPDNAREIIKMYTELKTEVSIKEKTLDLLKKRIMECLPAQPRHRGYGISVNTVYRKGSIDYTKASEKFDLEPFRKDGATSVEIRLTKE